MNKIGIGIIGAGGIAGAHAAAYERSGKARIVGISDVVPASAERLASKYDTQALSLEAMLASSEIEAVSICTPPASHAELAVKALQAGKHVLIEKPVAVSTEETDRILRAAAQSSRHAMVAHSHRFWPANVKAKALLDDGVIGTVLMVREEILSHVHVEGELPWRFRRELSGGGVVMDNGIHAVDRLRWWLGREVTAVKAQCWTVIERSDVEDNAAISLVFERPTEGPGNDASDAKSLGVDQASSLERSPIVAHVLLSFTAAPAAGRCITEFIGTKGVLTVETWGDIQLALRDGTTEVVAYDASTNAFDHEVEAFLHSIQTGEPVPVTLEDANVSLEVVERIYAEAGVTW